MGSYVHSIHCTVYYIKFLIDLGSSIKHLGPIPMSFGFNPKLVMFISNVYIDNIIESLIFNIKLFNDVNYSNIRYSRIHLPGVSRVKQSFNIQWISSSSPIIL